jgi:hypothetical protein
MVTGIQHGTGNQLEVGKHQDGTNEQLTQQAERKSDQQQPVPPWFLVLLM